MKLLVLLALTLSHSAYSQSATKDTSANCISSWKLGEEKTYSIIHEQHSTDPSRKSRSFRFAYEARVSVMDSTTKNYIIKWVFQLPNELKAQHPGLADSLPVFNGMQMIFKVSEMGSFIELLNWEEVRDMYVKEMELSLPKKVDSMATAAANTVKNMFSSKEMVESSLIKEIQLFHMPYGYKFNTKEIVSDTKLPSPFGGEPFPAKQTFRLTEINLQKDVFTLTVKLTIDKANTKGMFDGILKRMNVKDDAEMKAAKAKFETYDMQDYSEYDFINSTGWITRLYYRRTVSTGGMIQSDSYSIELKN